MQKSRSLAAGLLALFALGACQVSLTATPLSPSPTEGRAESSPDISTPTPVPSPSPSATPTSVQSIHPTVSTCDEQHGRIDLYQVPSDLLKKPLEVRVYLPPCFSPYPVERYPVLYMLHGQSFQGDQWDRLGINEAADLLISSGKAPPFLIIMPYEADSLIYPGDSPYDRVIVETLLPWAEAHFPICHERDCRAVGGLSRGAGWAMHLGFKYWQFFGAVGGHSLTPFGADIDLYPVWYKKIPVGKMPRLYIDIGDNDRYLVPATAFKDWLVELNIPVEWHLNPGTHNEEYWSAHVREYLRWYAEGF